MSRTAVYAYSRLRGHLQCRHYSGKTGISMFKTTESKGISSKGGYQGLSKNKFSRAVELSGGKTALMKKGHLTSFTIKRQRNGGLCGRSTSCRELWFDSQYPHGGLQSPVTSVPKNLTPFLISAGTMQTCGLHTYIHRCKTLIK